MHERFNLDIPEEIWDQIISLLDHDHYLEPLSTVSKTFLSITNRLKKTLIISNQIAQFIPKLFNRFPNLKIISFSEFDGEISPIIRLISRTQFPLQTLDLSNQVTPFPADAIQELPSSILSSIKSLNLSNCCNINDFDLEIISQLMINLEELDLSDPTDNNNNNNNNNNLIDNNNDNNNVGGLGITDYGIELVACKLSKLRKVNFSGNAFISDKSIISIAEKCIDLEEIVMKDCAFVTQNAVVFACRKCVNLRLVSVCMDFTVAEISEALCFARNLSVFDFSYMTVSDGLLYAIAKAGIPLKKFTLYHCKEFTFSGVLSLLRMYQGLEYFALEGAYWVTDRMIIDLSKFLRKASVVKFNFCSKVSNSGLFTMLKNCTMLDCLELEKTKVGTEEFAVNDSSNSHIRALCLSANKTLINECLEKISFSCPNLELLDVSDCPAITRKGIGEVVRRCTKLRHLQMTGCGAIKSLGIDAKLNNLEVVQASRSGLNDDGLITIAKKCPALINLDVMYCTGVTSKGVREVIFHCRRLREINLSLGRDMGQDIIAWMVFARPSLKKIILPPQGVAVSEDEKNLFLQHGCLVI